MAHRHAWDTIVILGEGNLPCPRFHQCDMFVSYKALYGRHITTAFWRWGSERNRRRLEEEEARAGAETEVTEDGIPLAQVTSFKYLGQIFTVTDNACPAEVRNLRKARQKWEWLTRVKGRDGADAPTSGQIYLAVV